MRTRILRLATLGAALAFALAACGGGDDEEGGGGEAGGEASGSITVWAMGTEGEKLGVLAKDFMQKNPGITVNVTPIAWEVAHDKLITSIAGGKTPDVSQMGTTWMGEFAKTGALEEVPDDIELTGTFEGARDTAIVDGTTYGVPWYVETRVLYYRKDIAEKAGITAPPQSWDELHSMAQALKEKGGARYGISLAPNNWQELLPFIWQKGFEVTQGFIAGTHPMFFSGPWHMGLIEEQGGADIAGKWAIAPMPEEESRTSFV